MDKIAGEKPKQYQSEYKPDLIVLKVGQPIPPGPGIEWWFQRLLERK